MKLSWWHLGPFHHFDFHFHLFRVKVFYLLSSWRYLFSSPWNAHPFITPVPSSWYSRCCCSTERLNEAVASRVSSAHRLWRRWRKGWDVQIHWLECFLFVWEVIFQNLSKIYLDSFFPMWDKNMEKTSVTYDLPGDKKSWYTHTHSVFVPSIFCMGLQWCYQLRQACRTWSRTFGRIHRYRFSLHTQLA